MIIAVILLEVTTFGKFAIKLQICNPFGSSRDVLKQIAKTEKSELKGSYSIDLSKR
jgi:hypothetical protein